MIKDQLGRDLWVVSFAQYRLSQTNVLYEMGYENIAKLVSQVLSTVLF